MNAAERFRLYFGPYEPPSEEGFLFCEIKGLVKVGRWSDGLIPWPRCGERGRAHSLILCDDLVRAVKKESAQAVAYHWGVSIGTVVRWRRALGVPMLNAGTRRLLRLWGRGSHRRPPLVPRGRQTGVLNRAAEPEDSPYRLRYPRMAEAARKQVLLRGGVNPEHKLWSREEHALVGARGDRDVAKATGRKL